MRTVILILLTASPVFALEPKYSYKDPKLDDEINQIYHDIGTALKGNVRISSATINRALIKGTTTNDSAPTGYLGEYIEATQTTPKAFTTTGHWQSFVSISLTSGDWDVTALMQVDAKGTGSQITVGISTTDGDSSAGLVYGVNEADVPVPYYVSGYYQTSAAIPNYRMSLSGTTNVYLKQMAVFSGTTPTAMGRLSARRIR